MKKYIYCLLLPFVSLLAVSCSDDDDKLPAVKLWTTSNANNGPDVWECTYFNRFSWVNVLTNDYGRIPQSSKDAMNTYRLTYGNLMNYATAVALTRTGRSLKRLSACRTPAPKVVAETVRRSVCKKRNPGPNSP